MIYIALTFWLLVIVLTAWGVHRLWSEMIPPRIVNAILLPGTLIAQLGHVLGLLITGATVTDTTLYGDSDSGNPRTTANPKPRIPVIGPVLIGMLPLLACATALFFVAAALGRPVLADLQTVKVGPTLPTTLAGFWQLLHDQITLVEAAVAAGMAADFTDWRTSLFVYLLICLTIRIAPLPGSLRGSLCAIVLLGVGAAAISSLFDIADPRVRQSWSILNLTVATLLFLMMATLVIRGLVALLRLIRQPA